MTVLELMRGIRNDEITAQELIEHLKRTYKRGEEYGYNKGYQVGYDKALAEVQEQGGSKPSYEDEVYERWKQYRNQ